MTTAAEALALMRQGRGLWAPELKGKVVVVTGAGRLRSIGRAIALEFARQGAKLVLVGTGRSPDAYPEEEKGIGWRDIDSVAEEVQAAGAEALALVGDIRSPASAAEIVKASVERFGGIDVLVNNAGAARAGDRINLVDLPLEEWERVLRTNLDGSFILSQAVARQMIAQGRGGSITNISSIASRLARGTTGAYAVSKAALNTFSRVLAMELAPHNIRVNSVLPGVVDTSRMDDIGRGEAWKEFVSNVTPLGWASEGPDTAYMCVFLASDMAAWMTGQDIAVDGGASWH